MFVLVNEDKEHYDITSKIIPLILKMKTSMMELYELTNKEHPFGYCYNIKKKKKDRNFPKPFYKNLTSKSDLLDYAAIKREGSFIF